MTPAKKVLVDDSLLKRSHLGFHVGLESSAGTASS